MLSLFRKTRHRLAHENQFLKYSRYALGEIVLVVIGILIALQINNWNEERKDRLQERKILDNLHYEFRENLENLKYKDSVLHSTIKNLETLFEEFRREHKSFKGKALDRVLSEALSSPTWTPSEFVLNDLKSSGNLTKLYNDQLKKLLYEWSRFYSELDETQKMIETTNSQLIKYLKDNGSLRNVDVENFGFPYPPSRLITSNEHLLLDPVFENYADDKLYVLNTAKSNFKQADSLIRLILEVTGE